MLNVKYSFRDFTGKDLTKEPAKDFDGEIVGSCFAQECPLDTQLPKSGIKVFPTGITTTFIACNLDNVEIPATATTQDHEDGRKNSARRIMKKVDVVDLESIENDYECKKDGNGDWTVDDTKPLPKGD
jgi:hypothetical protein